MDTTDAIWRFTRGTIKRNNEKIIDFCIRLWMSVASSISWLASFLFISLSILLIINLHFSSCLKSLLLIWFQSRVRECLVNLLTTCGQRVGLPKSPSVSKRKIFSSSPFIFFKILMGSHQPHHSCLCNLVGFFPSNKLLNWNVIRYQLDVGMMQC